MNNIKLMPCPHCGREDCSASAVDHGNTKQERWWGNIFCRGCQMNWPDIGPEDTLDAWFEKAAAAWNSLPRRLRWTKEKPTKEGWYWYRDKVTEPIMSLITTLDHQLVMNAYRRYQNAFIDRLDGEYNEEWAGPIPEPQEQP